MPEDPAMLGEEARGDQVRVERKDVGIGSAPLEATHSYEDL